MPDKPIDQLKKSLTDLSIKLDDPKIKKAIGCIPDTIKDPVLEALRKVLDVVKETLNKMKEELDCIADADPLLDVVNDLLEAAKGLTPGEEAKKNLDKVKDVVNTLKDIPSAADIDAIVKLIDQILGKLEAL